MAEKDKKEKSGEESQGKGIWAKSFKKGDGSDEDQQGKKGQSKIEELFSPDPSRSTDNGIDKTRIEGDAAVKRALPSTDDSVEGPPEEATPHPVLDGSEERIEDEAVIEEVPEGVEGSIDLTDTDMPQLDGELDIPEDETFEAGEGLEEGLPEEESAEDESGLDPGPPPMENDTDPYSEDDMKPEVKPKVPKRWLRRVAGSKYTLVSVLGTVAVGLIIAAAYKRSKISKKSEPAPVLASHDSEELKKIYSKLELIEGRVDPKEFEKINSRLDSLEGSLDPKELEKLYEKLDALEKGIPPSESGLEEEFEKLKKANAAHKKEIRAYFDSLKEYAEKLADAAEKGQLPPKEKPPIGPPKDPTETGLEGEIPDSDGRLVLAREGLRKQYNDLFADITKDGYVTPEELAKVTRTSKVLSEIISNENHVFYGRASRKGKTIQTARALRDNYLRFARQLIERNSPKGDAKLQIKIEIDGKHSALWTDTNVLPAYLQVIDSQMRENIYNKTLEAYSNGLGHDVRGKKAKKVIEKIRNARASESKGALPYKYDAQREKHAKRFHDIVSELDMGQMKNVTGVALRIVSNANLKMPVKGLESYFKFERGD